MEYNKTSNGTIDSDSAVQTKEGESIVVKEERLDERDMETSWGLASAGSVRKRKRKLLDGINSNSVIKGKKRRPYFTTAENFALVEGVKARLPVVEGKLSPQVTYRAKQKAWEEITEDVNVVGRVVRKVDDVRRRWKDLKLYVKKKMTQERQQSQGTDQVTHTEMEEAVMEVLQARESQDTYAVEAPGDHSLRDPHVITVMTDSGEINVPIISHRHVNNNVRKSPSPSLEGTTRATPAPLALVAGPPSSLAALETIPPSLAHIAAAAGLSSPAAAAETSPTYQSHVTKETSTATVAAQTCVTAKPCVNVGATNTPLVVPSVAHSHSLTGSQSAVPPGEIHHLAENLAKTQTEIRKSLAELVATQRQMVEGQRDLQVTLQDGVQAMRDVAAALLTFIGKTKEQQDPH
ncbi:uncharacterized protein LOC143031002 [Oratosquilla oratoria]|uniref:uncharacterized protein LOC143031002 n=1 Tax=Oratosquilla oratoria TaxID=337810 RepID=UPI003F773DB8